VQVIRKQGDRDEIKGHEADNIPETHRRTPLLNSVVHSYEPGNVKKFCKNSFYLDREKYDIKGLIALLVGKV
jgi:hypothetical protein